VIVGKAAIGLAKPVDRQATGLAPKHVVTAVAVEVADALDRPTSRNAPIGVHVIVGKAAIGLAKPVDDHARVVARQDIATAIAVEVVPDVRLIQINLETGRTELSSGRYYREEYRSGTSGAVWVIRNLSGIRVID